MTENRHFTGWMRTLAGLAALAGVLGLSACGGGNGAPNNVFNTPGDLSLLPNPATVYSGTPVTLTIAGGTPPYTMFTSDTSTLPVAQNVGSSVTVVPNIVSADTQVTFTARDARGATALSAITVKPAPLINSLTLKADSFSDSCPNNTVGSSSATDTSGSTFICTGQTGSVGVRLANLVGGGLAGRQVRFDIVQGDFQIFTELPGQPVSFALTYTVPTDQNGNAVARIRATPNANTQIVIVQATDVATGSFVRGIFVIVSVVNGNAAGFSVLPTSVTIDGPDTLTCSAGVATTYYIYGGQPPYTISNVFPQFLQLVQNTVPVSGGGFTVVTLGGCIDKGLFIITDSAGHSVTVDLTNKLGTLAPPTFTAANPIAITPTPIPTLTCGASTNVVATGGGTTTTTGGQTTFTPATSFFVSTSRPSDILTATPPAPAAGATITLNRMGTGTVNASLAPGAIVNVSLFVSDGVQTRTVNVPVINTCP
ncbi:MAG: hypothetical protein ABI724_14000 [Betaproteobacteria bacterium]